MTVTAEQLKQIAPSISEKALITFLPYINKYHGDVNTPLRMAAFLAQVLHESGLFKWVHELASGKEYEGRTDLGNTTPGDGVRYKGRGLIQITGKYNYAKVSKALYGNEAELVNNPDLLATPENAVRSAYWFWGNKNLNVPADAGDIVKITKLINGGTNGLAERTAFYNSALQALNQTV